jgi:hypothetical protein
VPAPAPPPEPAKPAAPVEPPKLSTPPPRRVSVAGGVVRRRSGPGPGAASLLVLASLLSGATAYMYCHKRLANRVATTPPADSPADVRQELTTGVLIDAHVAVTPPIDAHVAIAPPIDAYVAIAPPIDAYVAVAPPIDAHVAMAPPVDAHVATHAPPDAAAVVQAPPRDAATVAVAPADAGISSADKKKKANELYQKAHTALEDGDPARALELADEALALYKTQRTLLERARAEQRLDRIDEAIKSIDEAIAMGDKFAPAWETRALILWSAKRYDEARPAMQKYLDLDPEGRSAESFRKLLEPK